MEVGGSGGQVDFFWEFWDLGQNSDCITWDLPSEFIHYIIIEKDYGQNRTELCVKGQDPKNLNFFYFFFGKLPHQNFNFILYNIFLNTRT